MRIPLTEAVASEIELRLARFARGWSTLDPQVRATAFKILVLCEMLGGRKKAAAAADVADNTLDNYRHGKKDPTFRTLELMARKADIASRYLGGDWSFDGDSIRIDLAEPSGLLAAAPPGMMDGPLQAYFQGYDEIRAVSAIAATKALEEHWERLGIDPASVTTLLAEGDSMVPTIAGQTPVFVDRSDRALSDGAIYAFTIKDELVIRRVQRLVGGGLQLLADNRTAYPPEQIDEQDVSALDVIGRVRSGAVAY
jgi:SOS-response transcriptional repressor LexA